MSKQDYERIAAAVRDARPISNDMMNLGVQSAHHALDMFVHSFADREMNSNPRFDREKFALAANAPINRFAR